MHVIVCGAHYGLDYGCLFVELVEKLGLQGRAGDRQVWESDRRVR